MQIAPCMVCEKCLETGKKKTFDLFFTFNCTTFKNDIGLKTYIYIKNVYFTTLPNIITEFLFVHCLRRWTNSYGYVSCLSKIQM